MEPISMKEAFKFLTESVKRCSMEVNGVKNESGGQTFTLHLEGSTGERPEKGSDTVKGDDYSIQGEISLDGLIETTKENPFKMCVDGYINVQSEKEGETITKGDKFQVCLDVGEKLITYMSKAKSTKKAANELNVKVGEN